MVEMADEVSTLNVLKLSGMLSALLSSEECGQK